MIEEQELNLENAIVSSFKKNVLTYLSINLLIKVTTLALWFVFARLLIPAEIGKYTLAVGLIEIISIFCVWSTDASILRFHHKEKQSEVLSSSLSILMVSAGVFLTIFGFSAKYLYVVSPGFHTVTESVSTIILILLVILLNSLVNLFSFHYTALGQSAKYAKFQIGQSICFIICSLLLIVKGFGFKGLILGRMISLLIPVVACFIEEKRFISMNGISKKVVFNLLEYGTPLTAATVIGVSGSYFGRFLLDRYTDLSTLGVYSFFLMITTNIHMLFHGFNQAWTPKIFYQKNTKVKDDIPVLVFKTVSLFCFLYMAGLTFLTLMGQTPVFELILKKEYILGLNVFYVMLLGPLFSGISVILYPVIYYHKNPAKILNTSLACSVISISINLFMVRYYGIKGAALSYLLTNVIALFLYLMVFKKEIDFKTANTRYLFLMMLMLSVGAATSMITHNTYILVAFLSIMMFFSYKRNDIKDLLSKFVLNIIGSNK